MSVRALLSTPFAYIPLVSLEVPAPSVAIVEASPKSVAFAVEAKRTKSITFTLAPAEFCPAAQSPLVAELKLEGLYLATVKSP